MGLVSSALRVDSKRAGRSRFFETLLPQATSRCCTVAAVEGRAPPLRCEAGFCKNLSAISGFGGIVAGEEQGSAGVNGMNFTMRFDVGNETHVESIFCQLRRLTRIRRPVINMFAGARCDQGKPARGCDSSTSSTAVRACDPARQKDHAHRISRTMLRRVVLP